MADDYKREAPPDWSVKAKQLFTVKKVQSGYVVEGMCPFCRHDTATPITPRIYVGGVPLFWLRRTKKGAPPPGTVTIVCTCRGDHPGRPEGKRGCGRFGKVKLRPKGA